MSQNLFALVNSGGVLQVRRIHLHGKLQKKITDLLTQQEKFFFVGIDEEVTFDGDWKPEDHQLLVIKDLQEISLMVAAIKDNASSYDALDLANFEKNPIKALFSGYKTDNAVTVQIQSFMSSQMLLRNKIPVIGLQKGNTFSELTEPMFTMSNRLVAVIHNDKLKFKSFFNLRTVFDLSDIYQEATEDDLDEFAQHNLLSCEDLEKFKDNADSSVRKMVHLIVKEDLISHYGVQKITNIAENFPEVNISISKNKIQLPDNKKELKILLKFLLDNIFEAPLSGINYQTNSKRPMSGR